MTTIYLDHNIIDGFDKGETAYLGPVFAKKEYLPIISVVSVDEIFRGGDQSRSIRNIESLKKLGVRYIDSDIGESPMSTSELDYDNMHQKWLQMQSNIGPFRNFFFLFISTLFREREPETVQDMEQAIIAQINWIKNDYDRFPILQPQINEVLKHPDKHKQYCMQLIGLKKLIPFTPKKINNIPENSVFWSCVEELKNSTDENLKLIGNEIKNAIENAKTIGDQIIIAFFGLNLFGYYPDNLTRIESIRSNFSDALHATHGIACDAILTLDKRFAKRIAAVIGALKLGTEVGTDANELLHRIAENPAPGERHVQQMEVNEMKALWTWGGTFFGHRDGDNLWTHDGRHVGRFYDDEVYGPDGRYLGEIKSDNRLITCCSKRGWHKGGFSSYANRMGFVPYSDYVGYVMYAGHEDFPAPDQL